MTKTATAKELPVFIGGKWRVTKTKEYQAVFNPSTGEEIARAPLCGADIVDDAVQAAAEAFKSWSRASISHRSGVMFKYKAILEAHFEELSRLVTRENGKTLDEAKGDVRRGIEVVEYACGIAELSKGESVPAVADHIDGVTMREPIGVCAGITPFNFPAMVPMWMYPMAIACGNTFILKPSEKVPLTAIRLAELFAEAGLPNGVLNIVHGGREVVDALCSHPGISAVSFVGSSKVAEHVYRLGSQHGKRVQAAGGAKNVLVVMPDADPEPTIRAIMGSSFGCAGQRCMAGSVLLGVGEAADAVRKRLTEAMETLKVTDTSADDKAGMGPVIDEAARRRVHDYIERGAKEKAQLARDGRASVPERGFFVGPTLFDRVDPKMSIARDEIFGPVLSMMRPKTVEDAIKWANMSPYGNGASIFTTSGRSARQFTRDIQCGMVGVNVGVPAPMAFFSFSGWNQSFFGDLHVQGREGVMFYTRQKVVLSRWDDQYQRQHGW